MKKTKHQKFVEKMDGLFTPEIVKHIEKSKEESRENFEVRDFKIKYEQNKSQMVNETIEISLEDMKDLEAVAKDKNISVECLVSFVLHNVAQDKKGKWGNFADRMSGLTNEDITEHIEKTSKAFRGK